MSEKIFKNKRQSEKPCLQTKESGRRKFSSDRPTSSTLNREAERYEEMAVAQQVLARADADAAVAQDRFFEAETLRAEFRRQQAEAAVMAAAARVVRELEEYIKILNLDSVVFYHFESVH